MGTSGANFAGIYQALAKGFLQKLHRRQATISRHKRSLACDQRHDAVRAKRELELAKARLSRDNCHLAAGNGFYVTRTTPSAPKPRHLCSSSSAPAYEVPAQSREPLPKPRRSRSSSRFL